MGTSTDRGTTRLNDAPLLFNIFINDLFLFLNHAEITNYADDNIPYLCTKSLKTTEIVLENEAAILIRWFENNLFKINAGKSHVIMTTTQRNLSVQVGEANVSCTSEEILLGIIVDNKLTFDPHVKKLCCKATQKLHALMRISNYMSQGQK